MSDLLPCPFCGIAPNSGCNYGIGGAYVNCVNTACLCNPEVFIAANHNPDASLSLDKALVDAKQKWNTRAPSAAPVSLDKYIPKTEAEMVRFLIGHYGYSEKLAKGIASDIRGYGGFDAALQEPSQQGEGV